MSIRTKIAGARAIMKFDNWPTLLLGRLFYRNTGLIVYCKSDLEILVDHRGGDENGTRECLVGNMYRKYVRFFKQTEPANVMDIGANGGGFPLMLMLENVKLASVVCVEMNPATYSRLQVNLQSNLGLAAVGINAAVSGKEPASEILLTPSRGSTGYSVNDNLARASSPHVVVKTTTLEALYSQYFSGKCVDICKIDVEGAEYDLIDSCRDELLNMIRYLVIEFHDDFRTPAIVRRLVGSGFSEVTEHSDRRTGLHSEVRVFARSDPNWVRSTLEIPRKSNFA